MLLRKWLFMHFKITRYCWIIGKSLSKLQWVEQWTSHINVLYGSGPACTYLYPFNFEHIIFEHIVVYLNSLTPSISMVIDSKWLSQTTSKEVWPCVISSTAIKGVACFLQWNISSKRSKDALLGNIDTRTRLISKNTSCEHVHFDCVPMWNGHSAGQVH